MKEILQYCIDYCQKQGVDYGDVRGERYYNEFVSLVNGELDKSFTVRKNGVGIRVLYGGAWGFASINAPSLDTIREAIERALSQAKMVSKRTRNPVELAPVKIYRDEVEAPRRIDIRDYSITDKIRDAEEIEKEYHVKSDVKETMLNYTGIQFDKTFLSTEGADLSFSNNVIWFEMKASASRGGERGSYAMFHGACKGYEFIEEDDVHGVARNVGEKAVALIDAEHAPTMKDIPIIFDPSYQSILSHEILGHPSEADRVLGREAASAGGAWWAGKLGERIGSEELNVYDDPTIEEKMGYFPYDDEGVKARRKVLVEDGILVDHMHSRETASIFNKEPNAGMRAMTFEYIPLVRMSNTFIGEGDWDPEEIIQDTKKGVYVSARKDNSIDDKRYSWTISAQDGWLIENGERTTYLKDVTVNGVAPKLFSSIDAIGNDLEIKPLIGCGKGMQMLYVGNGGPHMRGVANIIGG